MRRVVDGVALVGLAAVGVGVGIFILSDRDLDARAHSTAVAVRRFEQEIKLRGATGRAEVNARGYPLTIQAEWFQGEAPANDLVGHGHPWVEVAAPGEAALQDPRVRVAIDESIAGFWYNPSLGIIRARVPTGMSDQRAVELYNRINRAAITAIFGSESVADTPIAPDPFDAGALAETSEGTSP